MSIETKTKKKINIDGTEVKVDLKVYKVLQNLTEALRSHEVAILTWVHKLYNTKKRHNDDEKGLYQYAMTIPGASDILTRMKAIDIENDEKSKQQTVDGVEDTTSDAGVDGSSN